jgi:hypothetical protein
MSLVRQTVKVLRRHFSGPHSLDIKDQDLLNGIEFLFIFDERCNYFGTVEGVVISRQVSRFLRDMDGTGFGSMLAGFWFFGELLTNLLDDAIVLANAFLSFKSHMDFFSSGLILGKLTKLCIQYYLEGFIFRNHQDFDFS